MTREEIIRDIHGLEAELIALEEQYGLLSADVYHCYRAANWSRRRISSAGRAITRRSSTVRTAIANSRMNICGRIVHGVFVCYEKARGSWSNSSKIF